MTLTPEQTALLERAKALVDANPNDHTSTMELVRGLVGIVEAQADRIDTLEYHRDMNSDGIGRLNVWCQKHRIGNIGAQVVDVIADYLEAQDNETTTPATR